MKVVHIGRYYGERNTGGAAIAATRLHRALRDGGIDSTFICFENRSNEVDGIVEFPVKGSRHRSMLVAASKVCRNIWRFGGDHKPHGIHCLPTGVLKVIKRIEPDIVHIHWITDECISWGELESVRCQMVVHLHDLWMINGFDHYPKRDRRYIEGFSKSNSWWLERWLWRRKCRLAAKKDVTFIGPSKWVKERADESIVGRGRRNFHVPYFQDPLFRYYPELRKQGDRFRILFGAYAGRSNPIKGFADLQAAIEQLPSGIQEQCELLVFGEEADDYAIGKVKVRFLGIAKDAKELIGFYHQADMFSFPSKEETWGQTKSEALLCGLPVVAFDRTACSEGISHGKTGWIAADGDIDGFANGIEHFFRMWKNGDECHVMIANEAKQTFDNTEVFKSLMRVYEGMLTKVNA